MMSVLSVLGKVICRLSVCSGKLSVGSGRLSGWVGDMGQEGRFCLVRSE